VIPTRTEAVDRSDRRPVEPYYRSTAFIVSDSGSIDQGSLAQWLRCHAIGTEPAWTRTTATPRDRGLKASCGDHLCQHSIQVANHADSAATSVLAPLHERRTSRPPQRGQTSPIAEEITSRSRTVPPFQWSDFRIRADHRNSMSVEWRKFEVRNAGSTGGTHVGQLLKDPVVDDVGKLARSGAHRWFRIGCCSPHPRSAQCEPDSLAANPTTRSRLHPSCYLIRPDAPMPAP